MEKVVKINSILQPEMFRCIVCKSRDEYFRNLHQPNLKENNFYNIREAYIEFSKTRWM